MIAVTRLLEAPHRGDRQAAAALLPLVYAELRTLAAARMAREQPDHTLQPTALVHEAYLRLVGDQQFDGRGHFFAAAAELIRHILVDEARRKQALKHGGWVCASDAEPDRLPIAPPADPLDVLAVHDARPPRRVVAAKDRTRADGIVKVGRPRGVAGG